MQSAATDARSTCSTAPSRWKSHRSWTMQGGWQRSQQSTPTAICARRRVDDRGLWKMSGLAGKENGIVRARSDGRWLYDSGCLHCFLFPLFSCDGYHSMRYTLSPSYQLLSPQLQSPTLQAFLRTLDSPLVTTEGVSARLYHLLPLRSRRIHPHRFHVSPPCHTELSLVSPCF